MTPPPNFLRDIALYYTSRRDVQPKFDTLAFVLPNKRSAMFLKKHVRDCLKEPTMMPRFMTMRTFISHTRKPTSASSSSYSTTHISKPCMPKGAGKAHASLTISYSGAI